MWAELGINLEKHDQLMGALPDIYKDVYLSQENRPANMGFWDFVVGDIHGLRVSEVVKGKKEGKPIIGTFCLYVPDEILLAVDAIAIGLCGGTNFSNYAVEDILPANTCPLIKSALGFGLGNICPYYASTDLLIGETTCDGKKKAWEILGEKKDVYVVETPHKKSLAGKEHYLKELKNLVKFLEDQFGKELTAENLKAAMEKVQAKRDAIARVYNARKADPVPISGKDALLVSQVAFYDDPDREIEMINKLADELEQRIADGVGVFPQGATRVIISGTPQAYSKLESPSYYRIPRSCCCSRKKLAREPVILKPELR